MQTSSGAHPASYLVGTGVLFLEVNQPELEADHFHLVLRLRMSGDILLHLHISSWRVPVCPCTLAPVRHTNTSNCRRLFWSLFAIRRGMEPTASDATETSLPIAFLVSCYCVRLHLSDCRALRLTKTRPVCAGDLGSVELQDTVNNYTSLPNLSRICPEFSYPSKAHSLPTCFSIKPHKVRWLSRN